MRADCSLPRPQAAHSPVRRPHRQTRYSKAILERDTKTRASSRSLLRLRQSNPANPCTRATVEGNSVQAVNAYAENPPPAVER